MNNSISQALQPIMQQLLDSAKAQYEMQLDVLQKEHARHIADIKKSFDATVSMGHDTAN